MTQYLNGVIAGKASQIGDLFAVIYIVIYLRLVIKALKVLVGDLQIFLKHLHEWQLMELQSQTF